jgi:hypothetical protein
MHITPSKIFNGLKFGYYNNQTAKDLLVMIVEKSKDQKKRIESLNLLKSLEVIIDDIYGVLENLVISDPSPIIRNLCLEILNVKYNKKILDLIKWVIKHEKEFLPYIKTIKILLKSKFSDSHYILVNEFKRIINRNYIDKDSHYNNRRFIASLKILFEQMDIFDFPKSQLAEILINYRCIQSLINKFESIFFEWSEGKITKIDFSRIWRFNWTSWIYKFSNGIKNFSEIPEVFYLKELKVLNLSNNKLSSVEGLDKLTRLTHIYLKNNLIENEDSLSCLSKIPNLKYLDLRDNKVSLNFNKHKFNDVNVILKDYIINR